MRTSNGKNLLTQAPRSSRLAPLTHDVCVCSESPSLFRRRRRRKRRWRQRCEPGCINFSHLSTTILCKAVCGIMYARLNARNSSVFFLRVCCVACTDCALCMCASASGICERVHVEPRCNRVHSTNKMHISQTPAQNASNSGEYTYRRCRRRCRRYIRRTRALM